jgi:hypothetical protein
MREKYCPDCYKLLYWHNNGASCCLRLWMAYDFNSAGRDMVHTVTFTSLKVGDTISGEGRSSLELT